MGGVVLLIQAGMWVLGLIVFFASVAVPVLKLVILVYLLLSVKMKSAWRPTDRTRLYRVIEVVGAWSMVDIYLLGVLIAMVQFGFLSTVVPGEGAIYFAAVVVLTMFAAHSFDPRLIWDNLEGKNE